MSVNAERAPGAALLHPLAVLCLLVLVVNDHVLKRVCPGFVTGKLSDFSGVLLLPLFLHAAFELSYTALCGRLAELSASNRVLGLAALVTAVVFALPELGEPGAAAYRNGLGALQWPFRALFALLSGESVPAPRAVQATADVTDLAALPMALVAFAIGRRRRPSPKARGSSALARASIAFSASLALLALAGAADAAEPRSVRRHDGFFLNFSLGAGLAFLDSTASISNGFAQSIPSTARGVAVPTGALELGGTLPRLGLVLGGRLGIAQVKDPVLHSLGQSFRIRDFRLQVFELQGVARWYPDPTRGLHLALGLGGMSVERDSAFADKQQRGYCFSLGGGHDFWIARQWSVGVDGRFTLGRVSGDEFGETTVILPTLTAAIVLH